MIERIKNPSKAEFYNNFIKKNKPVIITDLMDNWDAIHKWNAEYLSTVGKDVKVPIAVSKQQSVIRNVENGWSSYKQDEILFSDYIRLIAEKNELKRYFYLQQQSLPHTFPELVKDIVYPEHFVESKDSQVNIWIGSGRNVTPIHFDAYSNFLAQVTGEKRLILFSPKQNKRLYGFPYHSKNHNLSPIDFNNPNYDKYPKFKDVESIECTIKSGEVLFLPVHWWHYVESLSDEMTISVNFWWPAPLKSNFTRLGLKIRAFQSLNKIKNSKSV
ncbi:cupin-like domain-containing protein [Paenibacillus illinoisensis]|uniref:cupin-like domain-containing protein n=1 Tax=Paenibacillus illinoisensis TaxID=59845 RepID=UPI001C8ED4CC|nr:cupin-like domain-containing protein [Paenibacillus illinoisensis]MBY0217735.1 cupin-like domain-containing protein [Paenibacillus illinoisensis]